MDRSCIQYVIGIDEAGRGPLAGPVSVGGVMLPFDHNIPEVFRDSKKLSEKKRELLFTELEQRHVHQELSFAVGMTSPQDIDRFGIVQAVKMAMKQVLDELTPDPERTLILLDGGLKAPEEFIYQETHIKGDEKFYPIALASIAAKVTRDRHMVHMAELYPEYGFEVHKGYGTKAHREVIAAKGPIDIHRKTFLHLTFM